MNPQIKAGADIHAGDGGYSEGTQEKYDAFVKVRNKSLGKMRIEELMYSAGLTAQGCWDQMDEYDRNAILRFADMIVQECIDTVSDCSVEYCTRPQIVSEIREHFGVEE